MNELQLCAASSKLPADGRAVTESWQSDGAASGVCLANQHKVQATALISVHFVRICWSSSFISRRIEDLLVLSQIKQHELQELALSSDIWLT